MALRLKIVSDNAAAAGRHSRWTFGVNGGSIGRHDSNDWVLRDADRYVSGRHADIEHRGGTWWVRDLSTNGTFINDSDDALGMQQVHRLKNGDRIRIGEYDIEVEISGGNDFLVSELQPIGDLELDSSLEVKSILETGRRQRDSGSRRRPDAVAAPPVPAPASTPAQTATERGREEHDLWPGLAALCKGAGIDPRAMPPESRIAALHQAGQLLRETLVGFTELARTRADFAGAFGIASGARRQDATGPLAQVSAVEPLLEMMLAGHGPGDARAVDEIRSQFDRARRHEIAVSTALREALSAVLEKLDPDELESQLGKRAQATGTASTQLRLWNQYRELFRATVQTGDAGLPVIFLKAFARAYESITSGGSARSEGQQD